MLTDGADGGTEPAPVVHGLGWPSAAGPAAPATGLGWPAAVEVSRETSAAGPESDPAPGGYSAPPPASGQETRSPDALSVPERTRVLAVANQKGGVGKTTTVVNLAAALVQLGQRVLVVDLDPQGNASTALAVDHSEGISGAYEAVVDGEPMAEVVRESPALPGLCVVPASIDLAGAEIDLVSLVARESRLQRSLTAYLLEQEATGVRFDYVFIDCPPSLGLLTVNALVAAAEILVPIQCEYYALEGVGQLTRTVDMVRAHLNPVLEVSTILLTMHDARTRLSAGVADEIRTHFPRQVLRATIPRSVRISEAPSHQQTVMTYDPTSPGALSYLEAAREMAGRGARVHEGAT